MTTTSPFPRSHPDSHHGRWAEEQTLHVAAAYSNPFRWRTRRALANDFRRHLAASANVALHFGELAYGDRPHEVTGDHPNDVQLRGTHELFHKENLLNAVVRTFPADWRYGAVVDADFHFTRHDWALEAIQQLQHHDFVQLFSAYSCLSDRHAIVSTMPSFAASFARAGGALREWQGGWCAPAYSSGRAGAKALPAIGATGGAWAFRREAFDAVGGLLETCILGSGDWFMAFGLAGEPAGSDVMLKGRPYTRGYFDSVRHWQARAASAIRGNIGVVDCLAIHHWHGPMGRRGYGTRDQILVDHAFDPTVDVFRDWQGLLQLTPAKPRLRDAVRRYFLSRSEDVPHEMGR
jgi:hypothetical protein